MSHDVTSTAAAGLGGESESGVSEADALEPRPAGEGEHARSDGELLADYAQGLPAAQEDAFAALVSRHGPWVYASALRQVRHVPAAEDVTQAVFIVLARKAATLRAETILSGWLFRAVRFAAADAVRAEMRRQKREEEAAMPADDSPEASEASWTELAPLLDAALASLGSKDRQVVLLRFFERRSFREIGSALGGNENSARVRVVRALEKLRGYFRRRGVTVSAGALSGALFHQAAPTAPAGLMTRLGIGDAVRSAASSGLAEAVLRKFRWEQVRRAGVGVALMLFAVLVMLMRLWWPGEPPLASAPPRTLNEAIFALDASFVRNDPAAFVGVILFRTPEERAFQPVLAGYIRAESAFREAMQRVFNVRQRAFNVTFRVLCEGQPPVVSSRIDTDYAATNLMVLRFPFHFRKVNETWYWDWFGQATSGEREERLTRLKVKTQLLENLAQQIRDGQATNVASILERVQRPD